MEDNVLGAGGAFDQGNLWNSSEIRDHRKAETIVAGAAVAPVGEWGSRYRADKALEVLYSDWLACLEA